MVTGSLLHILIEENSKFDHGLTKCDLKNDKMNFRAVQKISDDRVIRMLDTLPGTNGTKAYLMLQGVMD